MKACKFCGVEVENTKRKCPNCGSMELIRVCDNCGEHFEGNFCPKCGVKVGQKGKICPECQTVYFTNACPNCGYSALRKTAAAPAQQTVVHQHVYMNSPTPQKTKINVTVKKKKKRWWLWVIVILVIAGIFGRGGNKKEENTVKITNPPTAVVTEAPTKKPGNETAKAEETKEKGSSFEDLSAALLDAVSEETTAVPTAEATIIPMPIGDTVKLDAVQVLFASLNPSTTREDVDAVIESNKLEKHAFTGNSAYYVGLTSAAVRTRDVDREGEAVDIDFTKKDFVTGEGGGFVKKAEYAVHTGWDTHYALKYEDGKFYLDGIECESGEAAMRQFLLVYKK